MLFQNWSDIARTGMIGVLAYAGLVIFLRLSGKRTLSKLNAFDLVVTVALGSTLSTILLDEKVALAEGLAALGLLILLQFVVTWTSVRWRGWRRAVRSEPTVLARSGAFVEGAMRRERVTEDEVMSAVRNSGGREIGEVEVVILESDGTLTAVMKR
ncbi:MAG: DUF421 domain-containing protein [Brevundimonas sp.]|nr:DUF421 domain-containing protein [Brevundimonas sp.]